MRRKTILLLAGLTAAAFLFGCGSTDSSDQETADETQTEAVTEDAEAETEADEAESDYIVAGMTIVNQMDFEIAAMYISEESSDDWGDNLLEDMTIPAGGQLDGSFTYNDDCMVWDVCAEDENGNEVDFYSVDFSEINDPYSIILTLVYSEEEGYYATIE